MAHAVAPAALSVVGGSARPAYLDAGCHGIHQHDEKGTRTLEKESTGGLSVPPTRKIDQGTDGVRPRASAITAEIANRIRATTKTILAASMAKPAMPPKPSNAAIRAITRNVIAQLIMTILHSKRRTHDRAQTRK